MQITNDNHLLSTFSGTVKLLKKLTPMTMAEAERCFSTLKRIKIFLRNTMTNKTAQAMVSNENMKEMKDFINQCTILLQWRANAPIFF